MLPTLPPLPLLRLQLAPANLPTNRLGQITRIHKLDFPRVLIRRGMLLAEVLDFLCYGFDALRGLRGVFFGEDDECLDDFVTVRVRRRDHGGFDHAGVELEG